MNEKGEASRPDAKEATNMDNGAIVHIDYDLFEVDSERLIETTREDVAKEHDIFDENREYTPMITVVGDGRLITGFEASLSEAESGKDYEIDIEPSEAYGGEGRKPRRDNWTERPNEERQRSKYASYWGSRGNWGKDRRPSIP